MSLGNNVLSNTFMRPTLIPLPLGCMFAACQVGAISFTAGTSPTSTSDYSITASAGLEYKTHASGLVGLGVAGATGGEIDVDEWLKVTFTTGQQIEEFSLAFFYDGPEHNDPMEKAQITVNGVKYYAQVTGESTVSWTGSGTQTVLSPATATGDGWFRFNNPFGDTMVTTLEFTAVSVPGSANNSDYSLATFTTVPDGGATLMLLGGALVVVGTLRRRFGR